MQTNVLISGVEKIGTTYELLVEAINSIEDALDDIMEGLTENKSENLLDRKTDEKGDRQK